MFGGTVAQLLLVSVFTVFTEIAANENDILRLPRSKPSRVYTSNMDYNQLLTHVMNYEKQWTEVLQGKVTMLDDPPYMDRMFNTPRRLPVFADGTATSKSPLYDIRGIVVIVVNHYSTIRSFVEYGAKAVRRALSCFAFHHILFQAHCLTMMMVKKAEPIIVLTAVTRLKENAGAYINVFAAVVDLDLQGLLELYWNAIEITQYDNAQHVQGEPYPPNALSSFDMLRMGIDSYLKDNCHPFTISEAFLRQAGIERTNPMMSDPSLLHLVSTEDLQYMMNRHSKFLATFAKDLGIVTIPDNLWTEMFFYSGRPEPGTNEMDATNPPVTEYPISST